MAYDQSWHKRFGHESSIAATKILQHVNNYFLLGSLVDFGAGAGHWVKVALSLGVNDCTAVDGPWTNPDLFVVDKNIYKYHDLSRPLLLGRRYDMAISLEAAQYLDEEGCNELINTLVQHSDKILFSSAVPYQGGDNTTERWQSHWARLFEDKGYLALDLVRPYFWDDKEIPYYYRQNTIMYLNRESNDLGEIMQTIFHSMDKTLMLDVIHPEKWEQLILSSRRERIKRLWSRLFGLAE